MSFPQRERTEMERLVSGLSFAEGSIANADGSVLVVETLGGRLSRVAADGSVTCVAEVGGGPTVPRSARTGAATSATMAASRRS